MTHYPNTNQIFEKFHNAEGGSRTLTLLPGRDFESRASASSATSAKPVRAAIIEIQYSFVNPKFAPDTESICPMTSFSE
jgi:hypothetical protein